jgi:hypothetical protein
MHLLGVLDNSLVHSDLLSDKQLQDEYSSLLFIYIILTLFYTGVLTAMFVNLMMKIIPRRRILRRRKRVEPRRMWKL